MATYAIGDVQGCYPELQRLLEKLRFDTARDELWFCGDLVNRGGQSLETLRLIHSLRESSVVTLGNHDLSLLAIAQRKPDAQARVNPELREVLFAHDAPVLFEWMRSQKLLHHDEKLNWTMIHAGLAPVWTLRQAQRAAQEVERELSTINTLTRMRYCDVNGRIDFDAKGVPGTQKPGLYPWFEVPGMRRRDTRIVCGHWSALERFAGFGVHAIDTGCVWGGKLTALRLDAEEIQYITVDAEPHRVRPPGGGD
jgi:bis(5'-nucleosyl)-tetraphosphatase (symmetrical)